MNLRIKEILGKNKITITSFAKKIGITQANMSNIVNGKSKPSLETLEKIAKALNVETWELFTSSTNTNELTALIDYKGVLYRFDNVEALKEFTKGLE